MFITEFADCAISALYALDGDPAAWAAAAVPPGLDRQLSHAP